MRKVIADCMVLVKNAYPYFAKDMVLADVAKAWDMLLSEYTEAEIAHACKKAIKTCTNPPTPADIVRECEKVRAIGEKTDEELWNELSQARAKAEKWVDRLNYPYTGKENKDECAAKITDIFNGMSEPNKKYLVNVWGFLAYCGQDEEYEKGRYLRAIPQVRERIRVERDTPEEVKQLAKGLADKITISERFRRLAE